MKRYQKIPLQRITDNYIGRALNLAALLNKKIRKKNLIKNPKKVTIFRLSSIGDSILLLPAINNLKEKTGAEITVICSKENFPIFEGQPFIRKIIILDNKSMNPFKVFKILRKIRKENADLTIDTTHSSNLSAFFSSFGGKFHVGFSNPETRVRNKVYDKTVALDSKKQMVFNYLDLFNLTGAAKYDKNRVKLIKPMFSDKDKEKISERLGNKKKLVGIHIVSELPYKKWSADNFVKLINLVQSRGYTPVLVSSPSEKKLVKSLLKKIDGKTIKNIIDLSGDTSVKELLALMSRLSVFVSIDGGPMHIASSMGVPTLGLFSKAPEDPILGLFGSEDMFRYRPFSKESDALYSDDLKDLEFSEVKNILEKIL